MEKGEEVYIKRDVIYGEGEFRYQRGMIVGKYSNHILVEFKCSNGNSFKESFRESEIYKRKEIERGGEIY